MVALKLGETFAIARKSKGWTLRDVEWECGVSNALISQIETGKIKDPGFFTVTKLALALDLPLDRFIEPYVEYLENLKNKSRHH
ncbi:MAG: helix-turn-helix domain-containing protein [Rhizobiaceae bacterium]|nr:helix-turn-helix domain-containing protein [Rhizobiaceae bacterium]